MWSWATESVPGGGGAQSGTVCGFERSRAGWRMPASLCSSELREGVTNTGLLVTRLAWMAFGEISSQLFKYIYPKVSLQSQPQRVSWEHWPAKISAVVPDGEGWGRLLSSQLPRSIYPLHGIQHRCFFFFNSSHILVPPRSLGLIPRLIFLKEKVWGTYLKMWTEVSVCPASARPRQQIQ